MITALDFSIIQERCGTICSTDESYCLSSFSDVFEEKGSRLPQEQVQAHRQDPHHLQHHHPPHRHPRNLEPAQIEIALFTLVGIPRKIAAGKLTEIVHHIRPQIFC